MNFQRIPSSLSFKGMKGDEDNEFAGLFATNECNNLPVTRNQKTLHVPNIYPLTS